MTQRPASPCGRLALALLACAALLPLPTGPVRADDNWTPFPKEDGPPKRKKAQPATAIEPPKPYLSPMDGPGQQRGAAGMAGQPYPAPAGMEPAGPTTPGYGTTGYDGSGRYSPAAGGAGSGAPVSRENLSPPPPVPESARGVDRGDLQPVLASDGSGLPMELWQGLDLKTLESLIARIEIPPRSPAIHDLWRRLVTSQATPPAGSGLNAGFEAIRAEVLFRSGLVKEAGASLAGVRRDGSDTVLTVVAARSDIALGERDQGCAAAKAVSAKTDMPKPLRAEAIQMLGYCAASAGNVSAAGLAAELARDEGVTAPGLAILDAVAAGTKPSLTNLKSMSVVDYRLLQLAKAGDDPLVVARAQPSLLALLAQDVAAPAPQRLAAAEAAARLNALSPEALGEVYRALGTPEAGEAPAATPPAAATASPAKSSDKSPDGGARQRAAQLKAIEVERTPLKKVRQIRAFLDDARRAGLYLPALQLVARPASTLPIVPEIGWFAETGAEIALAAGDFARTRQWASFGATLDRQPGGPAAAPQTGLTHWLALADIADPNVPKGERGRDLGAVEELGLRGRFTPDQLHRLATVLDALDYNVPMRLWEAASRTPQPTTGHLPATGVLSQLQDASKKKEFGRTVLLAMDALGPHGAEGAHMISLGDAIRALRRAGLDREARRLGLEALFAAWPRATTN